MKYFKSLWFIIPATLLTIYTLLGFLLVPYIITDIVPEKLAQNSNIVGKIKHVKFNPFTYSLSITKGEFKTKDKKPLFSIDELNTTLKPSGLFTKNIKFENIILTKPYVSGIINKKGKLNFANLMNETNATKPQKEEPSNWNIVIELLDIKNGAIAFEDERKNYKTKLENLNYTANDLSTKQNDMSFQKLVLTSTSAKNLTWDGTLSLKPLYSNGKISINDLKVHEIWDYSLGDGGIYPKSAYLNLDISYDINYTKNSFVFNIQSLDILIQKIKLFSKKQKISTIEDINLNAKNLNFQDINKSKILSLKNLNFNANKLELFSSNLLKLNAKADKFSILDFAFDTNLQKNINASFLQTNLEKIDFLLNDKNITIDGNLAKIALNNLKFQNDTLKLKNINLNSVNLGKKNLLNTPFFTSFKDLSLSAIGMKLDKNSTMKLDIDNIAFKDIITNNKNLEKPFLHVKDFSIKKSSLTPNKFEADNVNMQALKSDIFLDKEKNLNIIKGLQTQSKSKDNNNDKNTFAYLIKNLTIENSSLNFEDNSLKIPFKENIFLSNINLQNISNKKSLPIKFSSSINAKNLNTKTKGKLFLEPLSIDVNFDVNDKDLTRISPYIKEFVSLELQKGGFKTKGNLSLKKEILHVKADASLENINIATKDHEKLSSFKSLDLKGIEFKPEHLKLEKITLNRPKGYITIDKKGNSNISYLTKNEQKKKDSKKEKKSNFAVDIDRLTITNGDFFLKNNNLPKPSTISVKSIYADGRKLYQSSLKTASLKVKAIVDKKGFLEAKASLTPQNIKHKSKININLKGLDLKALNSYGEKYLGYTINKGSMSTTFTQTINKGKLKGQIQSGLDSFFLGKSVKSKDALGLPLDLALGILRDSQDNVNLNIPVGGDMNKPNFSYGSVVVTAITNILTGIVTAPFSMLGNMIGVDGEKLKHIAFKPSLYELDKSEEEKMKQYAKILTERPKLKLTVTGAYDKNVDFKASEDGNETNTSKPIKVDIKEFIALGEQRSQTVKQSLEKLGISSERILIKKPVNVKAYHGEWIRCNVGIAK